MRKINNKKNKLLFFAILVCFALINTAKADNSILTPQENLWLKSRNNTIVVYPEKNYPPFSYQNSSGVPQGLSVDYIELVAQKIGAKVEYLQARPLSQILEDTKNGKGDVLISLADTVEREDFFYFTDNYISVPAVIVVRKDSDKNNIRTLGDLSGKKVAVGDKYAVEDFIRKNNPRAIIEPMTDDEISLQQVVLGEVDAAVMDIGSLSYYLSKQVLNSVKVVGNVGFEYKLSFAVPKDKQILQSILDKGLTQISSNDRQIFNDKWITVPGQTNNSLSFSEKIKNIFGIGSLYTLFIVGLIAIIIVLIHVRRHHRPIHRFLVKNNKIKEMKEEISQLEDTSRDLVEELKNIRDLEEDIKDKIKIIDKS